MAAVVTGPTPWKFVDASMPGLDCATVGATGYVLSDTVNFNSMFRGIYVGGTGNIVLTTPSGNTVTFNSVAAGIILPVCGIRLGASTTATNMIVLIG